MYQLTHYTSSHLAAGGILDASGLYNLIAGSWIKVALLAVTFIVLGKAMKADASKVATIVGLSIVGLAWLAISSNQAAYQSVGKGFASLIGLGS